MRKLIFVTLLLLLVSFGLCAGGQQEEAETGQMVEPMDENSNDLLLQKGLPALPDKPVKIEFLTTVSGDAYQYIEKWINDILPKYYPNLEVEAQPLGSGDLKQIVNTRLAAGNPPEVVMAAGSYLMRDWADAGVLVDTEPLWETYELDSITSSGVAASLTFNDVRYGVPFHVGQNNILYWNISVLQEAGVPLPPYESWDEFFAAAEQFSQNSDKDFWVGGYSPDWFGMEKTIMLGAARFGIPTFERVVNGKATAEDFRNYLEFHKNLFEYGNQDFVSMHSVTGGVETVGAGEGALAMAGGWGYPRMVNNNLEYKNEWDMGRLPGTDTFAYVPMTMMVFKDSAEPEAGQAFMLTGLLKEFMAQWAASKGVVPGRTDVESSSMPDIGRVEVARYSNQAIQSAISIPRAVAGLPNVVHTDYPTPFSGYMAGAISLEEAVKELMKLQAKNADEFVIQWDLD